MDGGTGLASEIHDSIHPVLEFYARRVVASSSLTALHLLLLQRYREKLLTSKHQCPSRSLYTQLVSLTLAFVTTKLSAGPLDGVDQWSYIVNDKEIVSGANEDFPRQEMMYNFDPYMMWAGGGDDDG